LLFFFDILLKFFIDIKITQITFFIIFFFI
jgi:hypothetical protein